MSLSKTTLEQQSTETRLLTMEFTEKMSTGETISSLDTSSSLPAGITFGAVTLDKRAVNLLCSGGTNGKQYKITMIVTTSLGQVLENEGYLKIKDI